MGTFRHERERGRRRICPRTATLLLLSPPASKGGKKGKRESPKLKSNSPPPPSPSFRQNTHLCSHRSRSLAHVSDGDGNGEGGILLPEKGKKGREGKEKGLFWYTCVVLFQAGAKWPIGKWARGWKCVRCGGGKPASGAISDPSLQRDESEGTEGQSRGRKSAVEKNRYAFELVSGRLGLVLLFGRCPSSIDFG